MNATKTPSIMVSHNSWGGGMSAATVTPLDVQFSVEFISTTEVEISETGAVVNSPAMMIYNTLPRKVRAMTKQSGVMIVSA